MKKYQVGVEFDYNGEVKSTRGLISGRAIEQIKQHIKLNKKTNTYTHAYFDQNMQLIELWKLTKKEYDVLNCGWGLTDFGDFAKSVGLI